MPIALYREYRPRTFAELVGQEHVSRTLRNAIRQARLAHAYLFTGPRGTGKTSMARILAKALNCPNAVDGEPCGVCPTCETIATGDGVDVLEMDAASNRGIEEIRTLRERIRLAPVGGKFKIYVIDEVHMLTNEAFNALLKTLEEPPANVVFILCTTEAYRVPPTILSRCQRFDFHRHATSAIAEYLVTVTGRIGREAEPAALHAIARAATGSLRDALSILDQCLAYTAGNLTLDDVRSILGAVDAGRLSRLTDGLLAGDLATTWRELDGLLEQGRDAREMSRMLGHHFRDLLLYRLAGPAGEPSGPLADDQALLARQAGAAGEDFLYSAIDLLASGEGELRLASQPRLVLEARLLRLCGARSTGASPTGQAMELRNALPPAPPARPVAGPAGPDAAAESRPGGPPPSVDKPPAGGVRRRGHGAATQAAAEVVNDSAGYAHVPLPDEPPAEDGRTVEPVPAGRIAEASPVAGRENSIAAATAAKAVGTDGAPPTTAASGGEPSPISTAQLSRAWQGALAQLPDTEAGYLAGATPECGGRAITVWLAEGMDFMADYLASRETCRRLAAAMAGVLGTELPVAIKVRPRRGLFENGGGTRGSGLPPTPANGARPVQATAMPGSKAPPAQSGTGENEDSDLREAQLMFRAEEVGKGETGA